MSSDRPGRLLNPDIKFLIRWIWNGEFGLAVGFVVAAIFGRTPGLGGESFFAISGADILGGLFLGFFVGYLQSAQLKPWLGNRSTWTAVSALGWALSTLWFRNSPPNDSLLVLLMYALPIALGFLQWLILRGVFARAGWWVALSYVGALLTLIVLADLSLRYASASRAANPLGMLIPLVLFPLPYSLITGVGFGWIIRGEDIGGQR